MYITPNEAFDTRRVILLRLPEGTDVEVLLVLEGTEHAVPEVRIARSRRITEQLRAALNEIYRIDAFSLSSLDIHRARSETEAITYEIMELRGVVENGPNGTSWVSVNSLVRSRFRDHNDFQAIQLALAQSICSDQRGPFVQLGWFDKLQLWVGEAIRPQGLHLTGRFRQLNAGPTFSLINFETDGPPVWFKAVGAPIEREYALTVKFAHSFPRFLPQVIAIRPELNGWLTLDAEGPLLCECSSFLSWEAAAADLAQLQICSLERPALALEHGAHDLRIRTLRNLVVPFLQDMGETMERQRKMPPKRLSRDELQTLSRRVQDALDRLEKAAIPETLGHMDLNPGNVVCSRTGCVFLDWAEAFVGHPFLSFQFLLEHFRRRFGEDSSSEAKLVTRYVSPWRELFLEKDIANAIDLTPLIAAFGYAAGTGWWVDPEKRNEPHAGRFLRSLARRMDREARTLAERRVLCPR